MMINDVHRGVQKNKNRKRIGRGPGSGQGKTAGKGHKGQKSRSGTSWSSVFQGGTMPLVRRVPKRGFNNKFAAKIAVINVGDLENLFPSGGEVTPDSLKQLGIVKHVYDELKILGNGSLTIKLNVSAHRFSAKAKELIEQAGGTTTVLPGPTPVIEKQARNRTKGQNKGKATGKAKAKGKVSAKG